LQSLLASWLKDSVYADLIVKGQYVVCERASREEEGLFLDIACEVVAEVEEPASWKKAKDPRRRGGGRPYEYGFRPMLLVLMLMVRDMRDCCEMESHLRNNPALLRELGLEKAPSKSSIHSAASKIGLDTLAEVNEEIQENLGRPRKKHVGIDSSGLGIRRKSSWYSIRTHPRRRRRGTSGSSTWRPSAIARTSRPTPGRSHPVTGTTLPGLGRS